MGDVTIVGDLNLGKVCRVCLEESAGDMHSLFSELTTTSRDNFQDSNVVYQLLTNISNMKIESNDGLPPLICTACLELALTAHSFQQKCNRTQSLYDEYCSSRLRSVVDDMILDEDLKVDDDDEFSLLSVLGCAADTGFNDLQSTAEGDISTEPEQVQTKVIDDAAVVANEEEEVESAVEKDRRHRCSECDKSYKFKNSLRLHMKNHSDEKAYVCTLCGKAFKQPTSLSAHFRSHSGVQPHECEVCGKKYRQTATLNAHMRVHTGHRPFLCTICGKGFRQAPDLNYHMRTHTKEKPYMCNVCGKTMTMQCHLVMHMRTHTGERPYECENCKKTFPSVSRLKRHAIIHTGLKPFTCDVCNKSFNRSSTLKVHLKIHSDERPHGCPVCGKRFIQPNTLRSHVASVHHQRNPSTT